MAAASLFYEQKRRNILLLHFELSWVELLALLYCNKMAENHFGAPRHGPSHWASRLLPSFRFTDIDSSLHSIEPLANKRLEWKVFARPLSQTWRFKILGKDLVIKQAGRTVFLYSRRPCFHLSSPRFTWGQGSHWIMSNWLLLLLISIRADIFPAKRGLYLGVGGGLYLFV